MNESDKSWWKETREQGRASYVFWHGIVPCSYRLGIAFVLILPALALLTGVIPDLAALFIGLIVSLAGSLTLSIPLGAIVGAQLWRRHESDYASRDGREV